MAIFPPRSYADAIDPAINFMLRAESYRIIARPAETPDQASPKEELALYVFMAYIEAVQPTV